MSSQMVFKRYEMQYLITRQQRDLIVKAMEPYMSLDEYGRSEIRNLYFDTEDFRLIRNSLERPVYKEKLRLRSYGKADENSTAYLELKKKFEGIVYKRRIGMPYGQALECCEGKKSLPDSQIGNELAYALSYYHFPKPKVFLAYEREAFYERNGGDFRVTFDENIRYRREDLTLMSDSSGTALLAKDQVLMELKSSGSLPIWMARILSDLGIYKTSYSKYGSAYSQMLQNKLEGGNIYGKSVQRII